MIFEQPLSPNDILALLGNHVEFIGDKNSTITGINEIHGVENGDITFVDHPKYYEKALKSIDKSVYVYQKSCPLFVPLAEEGIEWWDDEITEMVAKRYFKFFNNTDIDTLILGCTHYPLLKKIIKRTIGDNVNLVDSALITARKTKVMLEQAKLLTTDKKKGSLEIYTSDSIERFLPLCSAILGMNNINIQKCDVGE